MKTLKITIEPVSPYQTTDMMMGHVTVEDHIKRSAQVLYDEWVCDRRWEPADIVRLLYMECQRRGMNLGVIE